MINGAINTDSAQLNLWLQGNKLSLNVAKTEGTIFESRVKLIKLSPLHLVKTKFEIENDVIEMSDNAKYLGVQVDQQLKWSSQLAL